MAEMGQVTDENIILHKNIRYACLISNTSLQPYVHII